MKFFRPLISFGLSLSLPCTVGAQPVAVRNPEAVAAPAEPNAIPLYPQGTPRLAPRENWSKSPVIGYYVRNIRNPTLTPFFPKQGTSTGAAVIVIPGGGFMSLAIDHEGWRVAQALSERGITAFVLKYRVLPTPAEDDVAIPYITGRIEQALGGGTVYSIENPDATADALAALQLVRRNASRWRISSDRVGLIGFSAGSVAAMNVVRASQGSAQPNFIGYIYGPQARVEVPNDAPPLFDAIALDDPLFRSDGFPLVQAWLHAKRPVEVHGYQKGGHGFGLGQPGTTTAMLLDEFMAWLSMQGFLTAKDAE
jgi:dienelactone hydrolase